MRYRNRQIQIDFVFFVMVLWLCVRDATFNLLMSISVHIVIVALFITFFNIIIIVVVTIINIVLGTTGFVSTIVILKVYKCLPSTLRRYIVQWMRRQ